MRAMKLTDLLKLVLGIVVLLMSVTGIAVGRKRAAQPVQTFSGEIMDSHCATAQAHPGIVDPILTSPTCTIACVQRRAKQVLYDAPNKTVYQLDQQKKPADFAGHKVKIIGTLDKTHTIHVTTVEGNTLRLS